MLHDLSTLNGKPIFTLIQDGPLGIRFNDHNTAFPAAITTGATWDRVLMYKRGKGMGAEAKGKGIHILLGPAVGPLGRQPRGGRTWEGFSSDSFLLSEASYYSVKVKFSSPFSKIWRLIHRPLGYPRLRNSSYN